MRQERPDTVKYPKNFYVGHPSPTFERDVVDAIAATDTCVVAYDMHIPECLVRGLGCALDARSVGDVANDATYIRLKILQAFDGGCQGIGFNIGEHYLHA